MWNCEKFDVMSEDLFFCVRYVKIYCERWINLFVVNILVYVYLNLVFFLFFIFIFFMRECFFCLSFDVRGFMK